jgi:hypothetical protein
MRTSQKYNLIMPSTTSDNLFWAEFDAEFELTVTQIALNNADYWKTTHCDKIPMRNSPWRGSHKTNNLLRYSHSRRYQEQLRISFKSFSELIEFCIDQTELRSSKHVSIEEKIDEEDMEIKIIKLMRLKD